MLHINFSIHRMGTQDIEQLLLPTKRRINQINDIKSRNPKKTHTYPREFPLKYETLLCVRGISSKICGWKVRSTSIRNKQRNSSLQLKEKYLAITLRLCKNSICFWILALCIELVKRGKMKINTKIKIKTDLIVQRLKLLAISWVDPQQ